MRRTLEICILFSINYYQFYNEISFRFVVVGLLNTGGVFSYLHK